MLYTVRNTWSPQANFQWFQHLNHFLLVFVSLIGNFTFGYLETFEDVTWGSEKEWQLFILLDFKYSGFLFSVISLFVTPSPFLWNSPKSLFTSYLGIYYDTYGIKGLKCVLNVNVSHTVVRMSEETQASGFDPLALKAACDSHRLSVVRI